MKCFRLPACPSETNALLHVDNLVAVAETLLKMRFLQFDLHTDSDPSDDQANQRERGGPGKKKPQLSEAHTDESRISVNA